MQKRMMRTKECQEDECDGAERHDIKLERIEKVISLQRWPVTDNYKRC